MGIIEFWPSMLEGVVPDCLMIAPAYYKLVTKVLDLLNEDLSFFGAASRWMYRRSSWTLNSGS